jgi:hypothetical protein
VPEKLEFQEHQVLEGKDPAAEKSRAFENGLTLRIKLGPGTLMRAMEDSVGFQDFLTGEFHKLRIQLMDQLQKWRELDGG